MSTKAMEEKKNSAPPVRSEMVREPLYIEPLDPTRISVFTDNSGRMRLTIAGERSYLDVKAACAFPLSDPDCYIGFLDAADRSIGMLTNLDGLDKTSLAAIQNSLKSRYFIPKVLRILKMKEEFGIVYCQLETDHGQRHLVARGLRDSLVEMGAGELILSDVDGNRYRILDWRKLDPASRRRLANFI